MKPENRSYRIETAALIAAAILAAVGGAAIARQAPAIHGPAHSYAENAGTAAWTLAQASELQGKICQASIQDQIEWDYSGNRRWDKGNLEKICNKAKYSLQPGVCFNRVMHGNISHGSGTRWHWKPALDLCAGTRDANATIKCFSDAIARKTAWQQAIEQCREKP